MKDAQDAQIAAARPEASSWVAANAGSGKTRVLTDRVARLLLAGTEPQKILCLTYTKAAAAEMQTRLFRTLGAWAMMPDSDLRAALTTLGEPGGSIAADRLDRARTLFARALETPGGLKIQTIHAFCDALLRRFPLEAGVAPGFAVLEDRQARALRAETLDALADRGAPEFAAVARHLTGDDPDPLLREIGAQREAFSGEFDAASLAAMLGVDPAAPVSPLFVGGSEIAMLGAVAACAASSGPKDRETAEGIAAALAEPDPANRQELLEAALLTGPGANDPFSAKPVLAKPVRRKQPDLADWIDAFAARVADARARRVAWAAFEKSCALNAFARTWLAALAARKATLGLMDFDDLIDRARKLLERPETAAWVLWRLDGGLDHILVDEAQDTSPGQWRVIEAISAEFFAGLGARDVLRTIFVVGDEKQSIYSFQGADPVAFGAMRTRFGRMLDDIGAALEQCDLLYSFRSARPILALVDAVFAGPAGASLAGAVAHHPIDPSAPGRVEVWPFLEKPGKLDESPWDQPVDMAAPDHPAEMLAKRVASTISMWLDTGRALPGAADGRAIRPGDVLILVQRRSPLFDAVIRELKRARVPVAGADVLRIGGELAVRDLLAALRVAATSADDLSLAALLRSPLGGLSERELFHLAHGRGGRLWDALSAALPVPPVREMLRDLRSQADFLRPYELLQRLLIRHGGRVALTARLGAEAEDGIDALLDQALAYERVEPPTVTGFLAWIDRDEVTVKRRMEDSADQVRVMTVHGAKGLEAPIVILPDTARSREGGVPPQVLPLERRQVGWRTRAEESPPAFAQASEARRARQDSENRRLLYVALTRAKTWLIVAGAGQSGPESWHTMVSDALASLGPVVEEGPLGSARVCLHNWTDAPGASSRPPGPAATLPDWATRPPPTHAVDAGLSSPSALGGAHSLPGEGLDEAAAQARGAAVHLLLETLPSRPATEWPELAARLLPGAPEGLFEEATAVLRAPEFAAIFGPGALAEVDLVAPIADLPGRLFGRVDRLLVEPNRVLAVDFKSNSVVPETAEETPEAILRQMGAYAAALGEIWPGRRIETAILWTRAVRLMYLPPALTAASLARAPQLDPKGGRP